MRRRPLEPHAARLICMPRDLFGRPEAASSHHDQQGLRYLHRRGLQPIHRCSLRFSKGRLATPALTALSSSVAPIAHDTRLRTLGIRTGGQVALLLLLSLGPTSPPPIVSLLPRATTKILLANSI
jgi:hypothetical protein